MNSGDIIVIINVKHLWSIYIIKTELSNTMVVYHRI